MTVCEYCKREMKSLKRGICHKCYAVPEILAKYPPKPGSYPGRRDHYGSKPLPEAPTTAPLGSEERIQVYAARLEKGFHWQHPEDASVAPNNKPDQVHNRKEKS